MADNIDYMIRTSVMNTLIECRHEKELTQVELAKALNLKPTTVSSWEQGKSLPSIQMLYRLANYYQKTIGYMYGERENNGNSTKTSKRSVADKSHQSDK